MPEKSQFSDETIIQKIETKEKNGDEVTLEVLSKIFPVKQISTAKASCRPAENASRSTKKSRNYTGFSSKGHSGST